MGWHPVGPCEVSGQQSPGEGFPAVLAHTGWALPSPSARAALRSDPAVPVACHSRRQREKCGFVHVDPGLAAEEPESWAVLSWGGKGGVGQVPTKRAEPRNTCSLYCSMASSRAARKSRFSSSRRSTCLCSLATCLSLMDSHPFSLFPCTPKYKRGSISIHLVFSLPVLDSARAQQLCRPKLFL